MIKFSRLNNQQSCTSLNSSLALWHNIGFLHFNYFLIRKICTMKKILLAMMICVAALVASAQNSDTANRNSSPHKYYYYPSSNVYFDQVSAKYWYWDNSTSQWKTTTTAPVGVILQKKDRYALNYSGDAPWKNNAADMKKYKTKKDSTGK